MNQLRIVKGTTNIKIYLNPNTPRPVFWTLEKFGDKKLRLWERNYRTKRWEPTTKFYKILDDRAGISIPYPFYKELLIWLGEHGLSYSEEDESIPVARSLDLKCRKGWKAREYQQQAVDYLTDIDMPRHGLNAQTGTGKTVMALFVVEKMNMVPIIILPGQVLEQWPDRIKQQMIIDDDDIFVIQGYKSLEKLWSLKKKPKIFVASISTMRAYILRKKNYLNIPPYSELITEFGIGVKISDEAHMHFATNVMLDLDANVKHNIYLTATFKTGNSNLRRIFDKMYPEGMRYVPKAYDKYVNITEYGYMGNVPPNRCVKTRGYSHAAYEQHLMRYELLYQDWVNRILFPVLNAHYVTKKVPNDFKCIVFCRTVDFISKLTKDIQKLLPDKRVMQFTDKDPDNVLEEANVIVSTFGSCGTGKDIKKLYTVVNTVSFKAPTLTLQVIGRLRKLDGYEPEYVEAFDINIPSCVTHWKERARTYKRIGKSYHEYKIR